MYTVLQVFRVIYRRVPCVLAIIHIPKIFQSVICFNPIYVVYKWFSIDRVKKRFSN